MTWAAALLSLTLVQASTLTTDQWEAEGIQPDIEVPYGDALETAIAQIR
jgi:hypothetical protein